MMRTALVTGGTRGIGAAICLELKAAGYTVVANYASNEEAARSFTSETGIAAAKWDVGDYQSCVDGIATAETLAGAPFDILVNNAGVTRDGMFHKMTPDQWNDVIRIDLSSMFNMTRPIIDGMRERGFGRIINISSINGQKGQMGQVNYSAAKAGVIGFTKALAQETARKGITVNCIAPGYVNTEMVAAVPANVLQSIIAGIPVNRLGEASEIGGLVTYLASDSAGFMTGSVLTINGGQYMA
ncbi:acetoacetyl-CoA reductase [uncultured Maricaulis sp.]|uniref:acetoacetyl-CoA reductase n=1 Tax=uncultured Maricaulis sp. TaxID=174710 RepID=UPI0030DCC38A|tara:strand:+ start:55604 stop:56329 length:726 start_codon:yes stop_codon:yes gene_type:complete